MPKPRTYQTEAIIIKKTKLGEADRILTLYTPDLGKIQAVAKGIRRPRSKLAGHLELLTYSLVSFARGRNLDTIIGSQTIDSFLPLKSDLSLTAYALYVTELVNQFTAEHIENRPLFQLLLETMRQLCLTAAHPELWQAGLTANHELLLRHFELHLLKEIGYRPQLQECVVCRQPLSPAIELPPAKPWRAGVRRAGQPIINAFSSSAGGMLCADCRLSQNLVYPISVDALKVLRWLQDSDFDTVSRLKMAPELSRELEMVSRNYIKYLLEREVKSVTWLDSLREQTSPGKY